MAELANNDQWPWSEPVDPIPQESDALARAYNACFGGDDGALILNHLERLFIERRVAPTASDAFLRHVEGQRDAIAYILRMARPLRGATKPMITENKR